MIRFEISFRFHSRDRWHGGTGYADYSAGRLYDTVEEARRIKRLTARRDMKAGLPERTMRIVKVTREVVE